MFDVSSPNGILLFREASKAISGYGKLDQGTPSLTCYLLISKSRMNRTTSLWSPRSGALIFHRVNS